MDLQIIPVHRVVVQCPPGYSVEDVQRHVLRELAQVPGLLEELVALHTSGTTALLDFRSLASRDDAKRSLQQVSDGDLLVFLSFPWVPISHCRS